MKSVVLITKHFDDPHDYVAVGVSALAAAYARRGIGVSVICPLGYHSQALFEVRGNIEISRIQLPKRAGEMGFANRAMFHVHEISDSRVCDVIECIDADYSAIAAVLSRSTGAHSARVVSMRADPIGHLKAADADRFADVSIRCEIGTDATLSACSPLSIPLPIPVPPWCGPDSHTHSFVLPTLLEGEHYGVVSDAYAKSKVARSGWTLGVIGGNERAWMQTGQAASLQGIASDPQRRPLRIGLICTAGCRDDIAARHMLEANHLCIFSSASPLAGLLPRDLQENLVYPDMDSGSLAECMHRIIGMPEDVRQDWIHQCARALRSKQTAEQIAVEHISIWNRASTEAPSRDLLDGWKQIQQLAVDSNAYTCQVRK